MQRISIALVVVGLLALAALYAGEGKLTGWGSGREAPTITTLAAANTALCESEPEGSGPGIVAEAPEAAAAVTGTDFWVNVLCKFSDFDNDIPSPETFGNMFGASYPGLGDFWREQSYGLFEITAVTLGWYRLAGTRASYTDSNGKLSYTEFADDCIAAASADLPRDESIAGFNLVYNKVTNSGAYGTRWCGDIGDGETCYGATWLPPWAALNHGVVAHEMGHTYGLMHSTKPGDSNPYDNAWDLMSDVFDFALYEPGYGALGKHLNTHQKMRMGWLTDDDIITIDSSVDGVSTPVERLSEPAAPGYMVAVVPIDETSFFTVEARRLIGYDAGLAGDAIIIHQASGRFSSLVTAWPGGSVGDEGEMWKVGEIYANSDLGLTLEIESEDDTGFTIVARFPQCGDGVRELAVEGCDDGNTVGGDGCSADCQREGAASGDEARCIDALVNAGTKVSKVQMKEAGRCMTAFSNEKSTGMTSCVTGDLRRKVAKAKAKTNAADLRACAAEPPFGYAGADTVNDAASVNAIAAYSDLFGSPLEDVLMQRRTDAAGARCQKTAERSLGKLMQLQLAEYRGCVKEQAKNGAITSKDALARCLATATYDDNDKVRRVTLKVRSKIRNSCWSTDLDAFSDDCDPSQTISQCAERVASCRMCRTACGMNGFADNCDLFDDETINSSCVP